MSEDTAGRMERIGWAVRNEWGSWSDRAAMESFSPVIMSEEDARAVAAQWEPVRAYPATVYAAPEGYVESLEAERDELRATVERYREALEEICGHPWNAYRNRADHPYSTGVTDGHRCCTTIARRALNPTEET